MKFKSKYKFTEPLKCADCGKIKPLVKRRGSASFCKKCFIDRSIKSQCLRELNKLARGAKQ
jgi:hypothetical protein